MSNMQGSVLLLFEIMTFRTKSKAPIFFRQNPICGKISDHISQQIKAERRFLFCFDLFCFGLFLFRYFLFRSSFRQPSTFSFAFFPVPPDSGKPRIPTMVLKMCYCLYLVCIENQLETWWQHPVKNVARLFRTVSGGKECCKCSRLVP